LRFIAATAAIPLPYFYDPTSDASGRWTALVIALLFLTIACPNGSIRRAAVTEAANPTRGFAC